MPSYNRVNIYAYVAANNPHFVRSLAHQFGYEFDRDQPLASVLEQLVSIEGQPALEQIIENHPDKQLFADYVELKRKEREPEDKKQERAPSFIDAYMNFSGAIQAQQAADSKKFTSETSLMVLAGAVLIAFAIITSRK